MSLNFAASGGASTDAAKKAIAASISVVDTLLASSVLAEKNWRANYYNHFVQANAIALSSSDDCISSAEAGLASLRSTFQLNQVSLSQIEGRKSCTLPLATRVVAGRGTEHAFVCPMNGKEHDLVSLSKEMKKLVDLGGAEPSVLESVKRLSKNPEWLSKKFLSSFTFAILGAGSQMGPCQTLLRLGATVLAVDLKGRDAVWNRLSSFAESTPGTLVIPLSNDGVVRGCDILTDFEAIGRWIIENSVGKRIVIGGFLYADGSLFARVAVAADAVIDAVCKARQDTCLISLCSPTEVFSVPKEANEEARTRYEALSIHTPWERTVSLLSGNRYLEANVPTLIRAKNGMHEFLLQDSQVWQQGPNYAFAKLIQRWRNVVARHRGHRVSSNVAPASLTVSVMHNQLIRAGMLGCQFFGIIPFEPVTSNSLMTALAIHDLIEESSSANPRTVLKNPMDLFQQNAVHGGTWRCAYKTNSYTEVSAVLYGMKSVAPYVAIGGLGLWGLRSRL